MKLNIFKVVFLLIPLLFFMSCKKDTTKQEPVEATMTAESQKANDFFQKIFDTYVDNNPEFQTRLGIKKDYDKWNDDSPASDERDYKINKEALQWIKDSINPELLDEATKLSYDLFKQQLENDIEDYKYRLYNYPVNQMYGAQSRKPAFLINMHRIDSIADAEAYISRLNGFTDSFSQLIENLKEREEKGIIPPKFVFDKVIQDSKNILVGKPFDNSKESGTLLADFESKVSKLEIDEEKKSELIKKAEEALINVVKPAYEKLIAFATEQQKRATTDDGAWKFPEGEAFYNNALKRTTTTNMTADEIHQFGLSEVKRIHGEMNTIKEKVGFKGSLQEFFTFMKTDKQFYYPDTDKGREEYLAKAVHIIDSMKTRLDELFIVKPKEDIIVKRVETFREKSAGKAFYQRPAADGSRPGIYYANLYDINAMPTYQMEALAYHEGIPGHHMQLAIQQELENIPMFRKFGGYTAYTEGWGLYSEFIPKEMGFYSDPYSDFGRLAMELWRACRLVVDTGIHAKKWTRQQGIEYYTSNTPNAESDAVKMVERHIVMPSQATAYKIGMNKILELRKAAKEKLGDNFDIREYHDVVLTNGAVPLNVLEDMVNEWIESKSKS
ncbi:DUF885 domain-containing protein [Abyssalbus ytuae]|uniref:DUF885 domain-containing protein n=1 Tax=Abyssalbus ytuae TaxID=2926907 RepID=A0A9E6ZTW9_9FLAO|nr:DUF885 domain-containing protein [Abyssalbus ytuae]UOB17728.1 DUF885 domain-containing protein [Abyssalbus ytuae]